MMYISPLIKTGSMTDMQKWQSMLRIIRLNHTNAAHQNTGNKTIQKVLIANRGEIACRVMRTAQNLGIRTVAVYSEADKNSLHVAMADEAYCIGPAQSSQSYLNVDKIFEVANISRTDAIHPGYGFLSENVEFSKQCQAAGVIFVGPPAKAIRDMGIKSISKHIMSAAGVPVVRGYHGEDQSLEKLQSEAQRIGFPIMIKAVRGGGGKGMRIAMTENDFLNALESAKAESLKSFADDVVLLEQYISDPRHVEVQVFADTHGNAVHLFERDCSVQRRHQKIIEEAPAPGLRPETRAELGAAAVRAALAVGYVGAGTVEFILDRKTHEFNFMEMNTRLQVEHPITEMITDVDLVEWQLRIAEGHPLPLTQDQIIERGHAFEARVYAESPREGFLPRAGHLHYLAAPKQQQNVRVETGVREGDEVSVHYDPMIAKLVVWGPDRTTALRKLRDNLAKYHIAGLDTNVEFLMNLCENEHFISGDVHTAFIGEHEKELFPPLELSKEKAIQSAMAYVLLNQSRAEDNRQNLSITAKAFRPNYNGTRIVKLKYGDKECAVDIKYSDVPDRYSVSVDGDTSIDVEATYVSNNLKTIIGDHVTSVTAVSLDEKVHLFGSDGHTSVEITNALKMRRNETASGDASLNVRCPTAGVLQKINVKVGEEIEAGTPLYVVIAMKMEYTVRAPKRAKVTTVSTWQAGDAVPRNANIVELEFSDNE